MPIGKGQASNKVAHQLAAFTYIEPNSHGRLRVLSALQDLHIGRLGKGYRFAKSSINKPAADTQPAKKLFQEVRCINYTPTPPSSAPAYRTQPASSSAALIFPTDGTISRPTNGKAKKDKSSYGQNPTAHRRSYAGRNHRRSPTPQHPNPPRRPHLNLRGPHEARERRRQAEP